MYKSQPCDWERSRGSTALWSSSRTSSSSGHTISGTTTEPWVFLQYSNLPVNVWVLKFLQIQKTKCQETPFFFFFFCKSEILLSYVCYIEMDKWGLKHRGFAPFVTNDSKLHFREEQWQTRITAAHSTVWPRYQHNISISNMNFMKCTSSLSPSSRSCRCPTHHSCSGVRPPSVRRGWLFHPLTNVSRSAKVEGQRCSGHQRGEYKICHKTT